MSEFEPVKNRFIGFVDIMGFKNLVQIKTTNEVYEIMQKFKFIVEESDINAKYNTTFNPKVPLDLLLQKVMFSDSILLASIDDSIESAIYILYYCIRLLSDCMRNSIPVKGAIAFGTGVFDQEETIYFGNPLIDAYQLGEALQLYGIILHHTFEEKLFNYNNQHNFFKNIDKFIIKYKTPFRKSKKVNHYNLNWIYNAIAEIKGDKIENSEKVITSYIDKFYKTVSAKPRIYVDNTADYKKYYFKNIY
jgi:hypothetical protein